MPQLTNLGDQGHQVNPGGAMQALVPASVHGLPNQISASGNVTSNLIASAGLQVGAVGVTSTQAGAINVQRYLDPAGLIKQGAVLTQAITANNPAVLNMTDGNPFASFTVQITNTAGSPADLSNLGILLQGK